MGDFGVYETIVLIIENIRTWRLDITGSEDHPVADICEHGNEHFGSHKEKNIVIGSV
jgi:hypothetical protein